NVKRSWSMILAPNLACIAGVFTMGFGIMASVLTNNVAALGALANGVLPLRKVAQLEAERQHRLEMAQSLAWEPTPVPVSSEFRNGRQGILATRNHRATAVPLIESI